MGKIKKSLLFIIGTVISILGILFAAKARNRKVNPKITKNDKKIGDIQVKLGSLQDDKKDLVDIPDVIKKNIEIIPVKNVDEVLKHALTKELKKVKWVEVEQVSKKTDQTLVGSTH